MTSSSDNLRNLERAGSLRADPTSTPELVSDDSFARPMNAALAMSQ
jgi:hypothetical protein